MIETVDLGPADRDRIAAAFAALADYVRLERDEAPTPELADEFLSDAPPGCDPARSRRLGVEQDGRLIALAELAFGYPEPADAYLGLMHVLPEARGRGVGKALLARIEAIARAAGARRLFLAVLAANPRGRAFWEREGFTAAAPPRQIEIGSRVQQAQRLGKPL